MWIVCAVFSVIFCIIGWIMALKKNIRGYWASASSLAFVSLTLLFGHKMVLDWVNKGDWSALLDVVPTMFSILCGYVIIMFLINAIIIGIMRKNDNS